MRVGPLEMLELTHTDGNLGYTGTGLAQQPISSQPGTRRSLLHILPQTDIHGIMVLRYITIDVVQPAIPNLHIDCTLEYEL